MRLNNVDGCSVNLTENRHVFHCSYQFSGDVSVAK